MEFKFSNNKPSILVLNQMPIQFQTVGTFDFQMKSGGDDWETLKSFEIRERAPRPSPPTTPS
jgi:hypothetical protein